LNSLPPHPLSGAGEQGMGVAVSSSHVVSAAPSCSHCFCSSVGSLPWGAVLQEQAAPVWVPHGVRSPASKPARAWASLSTGPQVLPGACSSTGSTWGHSLLWASTCSGVGSSLGCEWGSAPPWASMTAGTACLTIICSMASRDPLLWSLEHLLPLILH